MKKNNIFLVCLILFISAQSSVIAVHPIAPIIGLFISFSIFLSRKLTIDIPYVFFTLIYFFQIFSSRIETKWEMWVYPIPTLPEELTKNLPAAAVPSYM